MDAVAVLTTAIVQMMKKEIINFRRGELYLDMNCSSGSIKQMEKGHLVMEQILNVITVLCCIVKFIRCYISTH